MLNRLVILGLSIFQISCKTTSTNANLNSSKSELDCNSFGAGVAFSCQGESTGLEKLTGVHIDSRSGSGSDTAILNNGRKFGVSDDLGAGCLVLQRDLSPLKSGDFSEFEIQLLNVQTKSGLGKYRTRLSTPMGTFGARSGFKFKALLTVTTDGYKEGQDTLHKLNCEID